MSARRTADGKMRRGTSNTNSRGSALTRRRRKCWMLAHFGDGISCACFSCARILLYSMLEADRIVPGILGGRYLRANIRPSCGDCNRRAGNAVKALLAAGVPESEILRRCRAGEL